MGELGASKGYSFDAGQYRVFNQCLDMAISTAIEQFEDQARQEQEDLTTQRVGFLAHELRNALATARTSAQDSRARDISHALHTETVLRTSLARTSSRAAPA